MRTLNYYTDLVTSQHRQPKFLGLVSVMAQASIDIQAVCDQILGNAFDVETAVGKQLDIIGEWVGITRNVTVPITGKWFKWDATASEGWEQAPWWDEISSQNSIAILEDAQYRQVIKAKILINSWRGDIEGLYAILATVLNAGTYQIRDNTPATMNYTVNLSSSTPAITQAIVRQLPIKLAGVALTIGTF